MAAPNLPVQFALPSDGGQPITYAELLRQLSCVCTAGAQIKPSTEPSAAINLGDIIADHARLLTALTSAYGIIAVVMKMISCIIDVLCAIPNPFAIIAAMIRLFGTCLPEFILIFPQLAIPAHILCLIKILVAIIRYITEVIVPIIEDIIQNVQRLIDGIENGNADAVAAVAFKITQLLKELRNILQILAALEALLLMVKALLAAGTGPPCAGSGGSCVGCADDQCPEALQQFTIDGTDGSLVVFFGSDGFSYSLRFSSASAKEDFQEIRSFFPSIDYGEIEESRIPYLLTLTDDDISFAVTSIDSGGTLNLFRVPNPQLSDGYLSSVVASATYPFTTPLVDPDVRFGTDTETFSSSNVNDYLELFDQNSADSEDNSITARIAQVYDGYSVRLSRADGGSWSASATLDPAAHVTWRIVPQAPSSGAGKGFSLEINHAELLRHSLISAGCHPSISAQATATQDRFPFLDETELPDLPDSLLVEDGQPNALTDAIACIETIAPADVDTDFVLDNYATIAQDAAQVAVCLDSTLGALQDDLEDYAKQIYARIFSPEQSLLEVDRNVQFVGGEIVATLTPVDIYGNNLADDVPAGTIEAVIASTFGSVSAVEEILDDDGVPTGEYVARITSSVTGSGQISASVADIDVADFDDTLDPPALVKRELDIEFVLPTSKRAGKPEDGSTEPLGIARPGGE